jgi:hypothetical protein
MYLIVVFAEIMSDSNETHAVIVAWLFKDEDAPPWDPHSLLLLAVLAG